MIFRRCDITVYPEKGDGLDRDYQYIVTVQDGEIRRVLKKVLRGPNPVSSLANEEEKKVITLALGL